MKLVEVPEVTINLVIVPEPEERSLIVPLVMVVVANDTVPVAYRLPVANVVEVALPNVDVAEVRVSIVAKVAVKLLIIPVAARKRVAKKLEDVALVRVEEAEVSSEVEAVVTESLVIVVVASDTVPVAVRPPVVNDPNAPVPEVILVNTGLSEVAIVEVPDNTMLEPALK